VSTVVIFIYLKRNEKRILGKAESDLTVLMECIVTKIWDFEKGKALVQTIFTTWIGYGIIIY